ncbi:MAG: WD40 repeat domain-containing protein, partial [Myxococcota bacterium]
MHSSRRFSESSFVFSKSPQRAKKFRTISLLMGILCIALFLEVGCNGDIGSPNPNPNLKTDSSTSEDLPQEEIKVGQCFRGQKGSGASAVLRVRRKIHGRFGTDYDRKTYLALSPSKRWIGTMHASENFARIWERASKRNVHTLTGGHKERVRAIAFSPDDRIIATGSEDDQVILWQASTGTLIRKIKPEKGNVYSLAFSKDGKLLFVGTESSSILAMNLEGQIQYELKHRSHVYALHISPDGKSLLSASQDRTAKLWSLETQKEVYTFGHGETVVDAIFNNNGRQILTGSTDNTAKLWDAQTGKQIRTFAGDKDDVRGVGFGSNGTVWTLTSKGVLRIWNTSDGTEAQKIEKLGDIIDAQAVDAGTILYTTEFERVVAYLPQAQRPKYRLSLHLERGKQGLLLTNPQRVASVDQNAKKVRVWSTEDGRESLLEGHTDQVMAMAAFPKKGLLFTVGRDRTLRIWNKAGQSQAVIRGLPTIASAIVAAPDEKSIFVGLWNGDILQYNPDTGKVQKTFSGHTGRVNDLSIQADGKRLVSASDDLQARIWDVASARSLHTLQHTNLVFTAAFAPKGDQIATGTWDKEINLWNANTGTRLKQLEGSDNSVRDIAWDPKGQRLVSIGYDRKVRLWSVPEGKVIRIVRQLTWSGQQVQWLDQRLLSTSW